MERKLCVTVYLDKDIVQFYYWLNLISITALRSVADDYK